MDQQTTHVAVTGHRPVARGEDRLFGGWKEYNRQASSPYYTRMRESLRGVVDEMLETHEHLTLHSGMALGVDTIWADVIVAARAEHPDRIAFTADIPTEDQAKIWLPPARAKWRELTAGADQVNVYADTYAPGVEGARNRGMVIGADTVIAIAGDQPSGSRRAIADAVNGGARLIQFDPMVFADETQDAAARRRGAAERPAGRPNSKAVKVEPVRVIHPRQASQAPPAEPGPEPPGEPEPKSEPDPALAALAAGGTQAARVVEVSRAGRGGAAMLVDLGDGAPRPVIVAPGKGSARLGQYIELTGQNIGVGRGAGKFFIGFSHNPEPVKVVQDLSNPALLEHDTRLVGWLMAVSHLDRRIAQMVKAGVDGGLISRAVAPVGLARIAIDAIDTPTSPEALAAGLDALARPRIAELAKYMPEADIGQIIAGLVAESAAEADGARAMVEALAAAHPGARPLTSINPLVSMDETIGEGLRLYAVYPANDGGPRVITRFPFKEVGRADLAARLGAPRNWEDRALNSLRGIPGTSWLRGRVYEEDWPKVETALGQAHAIHLAEAEDAGISAPRDQEAFAAAEAAQEAATARAILEYLDSENLPFRIKPNGARVDAVVERAGLPTAVVRLLDPQTPGWVGQVEQGRVATAVDRGVTGGERPTAEQALASVKVGFTPDLRTIGTDIVFRKDSREVTVDGTLIRTGARRGLEQAPSPLQAWDQTHKTPDAALPVKYPEIFAPDADLGGLTPLAAARAADRAARHELWFTEQVDAAVAAVTGETKLDDLMSAAEDQIAAGRELALPAELVSFDDQIAALQRTLWQRITKPIPGENAVSTFDRWMSENLVTGEAGQPGAWAIDIDNVARLSGQNSYAVATDLAEYLSESTPPDVPLSSRLLGEDARRATWLDRMVKFDPATAQPVDLDQAVDDVVSFDQAVDDMSGAAFPVRSLVALGIRDTLETHGVGDIAIEVDQAGVLQWSGTRTVVNTAGAKPVSQRIIGQIGKIHPMGALGEVYRTSLLTGDTEMIVPGHTVNVAGGPGSFYERMRLTSYADQITQAARIQVAEDLLGAKYHDGAHRVDSSSALTRVLTSQYDVRLPGNYLESVQGDAAELARREIVVGEYARRVRMPDTVADSFTEVWRASYEGESRQAASRCRTTFTDLGMRTPAILDARGEGGVFDGDFTNDSDPGRLRLLAAAADVDGYGRVLVNAERAGEMVAAGFKPTDSNLVKLFGANISRNAMDRRRMAKANALSANRQTEPVHAAQIALRGWTMEDGFVVSRQFAEANGVPDPETGLTRPLTVGDKLSDNHGNKGVIAYVTQMEADRDDYVEALFAANPELGVVYSPLSPLSRFNGSLIHEAAGREVRPLTLPDGQQPASPAAAPTMAPLRFIVSHMTVDVGTRAYGDDYEAAEPGDMSPAEQATRPAALFSAATSKPVSVGRSFSAQAGWVLSAKGADKIAAELFADKGVALSRAAEYLQMVGVSLKTDGSLALIDADALAGLGDQEIAQARGGRRAVDPLDGASFAEAFGQYGGDMIVPAGWDLEFPAAPVREGERPPEARHLARLADGRQLLPVLPASLRVGRNGMAHEYSEKYQIIFEQIQAHAEAEHLDDPQRRAAVQSLALGRARGSWNTLANLALSREIASRHGIFRRDLLGATPAHSANAVWSADPRLDLDEIAVGPGLAASLGLADHRETDGDGPDQRVLIFRDPVQHDGGVRYMKVRVDPAVKGVRINPVMVKSFDGDFDGDTVGLIRLDSQEAFEQAVEQFDVLANLLDRRGETTMGLAGQTEQVVNPLNLHTDADLAIGEQLAGAGLAQEREQINFSLWAGQIDGAEGLRRLNQWAHAALANADARLGLRFDDLGVYLESVKAVNVDTGAKGNLDKLAVFTQYAQLGSPLVSEAMSRKSLQAGQMWGSNIIKAGLHAGHIADEGVNVALVVKKAVGLAGVKQYQSARALRGEGPEAMTAVLGLSAAVNQGLLQAKHDPVQAMDLFTDVQTAVSILWDGDIPARLGEGRWFAANGSGEGRSPVTADEWVEAAQMIFNDRMGLRVSAQMIRQVADTLAIGGDMGSITAANGAPLDMIAYVEGAKAKPLSVMGPLLHIAAKGGNLYDGPHAMFAPKAIRQAQNLGQEAEALVDATAQADNPRRADEGRRYNDAEARRAEREKLFNPAEPEAVTFELVEMPDGSTRMRAVNIEGVEPDTLGGVVGEGVKVAHDGSWIGFDAQVTGHSILECNAWVVDTAQVHASHLVNSYVEGQARVVDSKLCAVYAGDNAHLWRVVAPTGSGKVMFSDSSRTSMVSIDRSKGDVEVFGKADISGRMHGMDSRRNPVRVIGAGEYGEVGSAPTHEIKDGRMVAIDIPGVEAGTIGAKVFGDSTIAQDGSWADENSALVSSRLSESQVARSFIAESNLTRSRVQDSVVNQSALWNWQAVRVQIDECVLEVGESFGEGRNQHALRQIRTTGRHGISVANSEIERLELDASAGPVALNGVKASTPTSLGAGEWTDAAVRQTIGQGSPAAQPAAAALSV